MTPEAKKVLVDEFEAWLRIPKVSWGEWCALDTETKAALLVAAKRIHLEGIALLARALIHPMGDIEITRDLDGGQKWLECQVGSFLDAYQVKRGVATG